MNSKFFSKKESSSSEAESSPEKEAVVKEALHNKKFKYESSSEDEGKRVVRTEKEKKMDDLQSIADKLNQHLSSKDYQQAQQKYEALQKQIQKSARIFDKDGVPDFILAVLNRLQTVVEDADNKANLNTLNNKAFNILR
jgi:translation initiation factor 3 subunit C